MQQIADWLKKLGMAEYAQRFAENRIDLSVLPDLTDQDTRVTRRFANAAICRPLRIRRGRARRGKGVGAVPQGWRKPQVAFPGIVWAEYDLFGAWEHSDGTGDR